MIMQRPFDLFVLDGWLPEMDGFVFCQQLREFDAETPILFYSGAAYETDKQKALMAGANAFVTKPDVDGLIETIHDLIATANARARDVEVSVSMHPLAKENWFGGFFGTETASD
jgi:DNA-binding response OmpR family regulator